MMCVLWLCSCLNFLFLPLFHTFFLCFRFLFYHYFSSFLSLCAMRIKTFTRSSRNEYEIKRELEYFCIILQFFYIITLRVGRWAAAAWRGVARMTECNKNENQTFERFVDCFVVLVRVWMWWKEAKKRSERNVNFSTTQSSAWVCFSFLSVTTKLRDDDVGVISAGLAWVSRRWERENVPCWQL